MGDGNTDSLWHYWYNPPYPYNIADVWGDPFRSPSTAKQHTYLNPNYSGYDICVYAFNECDIDTFCCNIPVLPNNVVSAFLPLDWNGCEGSEFRFVDLSTTSFPSSSTQWWFDYDLLCLDHLIY